MKITVIARLFTKGYMNVQTSQNCYFYANFDQINLRFKAFIVISLLVITQLHVFAQKKMTVHTQFFKSEASGEKILPDRSFQVDSLGMYAEIGQRLRTLYEQGYLLADYSVARLDDASAQINFFVGEVYVLGNLCQGNVPDQMLNKAGYKPLQYHNKSFSYNRLTQLFNSILDYAENHGYPFASVKLDSINVSQNELSACLNYHSGPYIVFDSLAMSGIDKLKPEYLMTHLGMYKGRPYEENIIKSIKNKLSLLPFIRLTSEPEILISDGKCTVILDLQEQKVSSIDGVLGLLPNENTESKMLITGQVLLDLKNLFASGKSIKFEWQRYDANSQLLNMAYYHPNIFRTPLSFGVHFDLLKQDTTFLNRSIGLDLSTLTIKGGNIGFSTDFFSSRLISTAGIEDAQILPENNDFNLNHYGLYYSVNRVELRGLPARKWSGDFKASVGQKKIIKNPLISDDVYDDIELNTTQYKMTGLLEKFWYLGKVSVLRARALGGYLNGKQLFTAELFRLGGLKNLRGFTEQSVFASGFGIMNLETRFYFSEESHFLIFFDQGIIANEIIQTLDYPFGLGTGLSFDTDAGLFNIVFALGKSSTQPFDLSYSKIHFGYIGRF